ncbi:MAG: pseudouridine-5'-phosphate glycosidase [Gemmataceae bacterium]|nr:pseudouridine-5'-phosphate glycosidase [Gemmataceae bacterium]
MIRIHPRVEKELARGFSIVALESSVIAQGLPKPHNLELASAMEMEVAQTGAMPATIAIIQGEVVIGCTEAEREILVSSSAVEKAGARDIAYAVARGISAGTTVSATLKIAAQAGIRVFATGGIGGVHPRFPNLPDDVSNDLFALAQNPVCVISSGAKSLLDLPATMEFLETLGVPVLGWQTSYFPSFFMGSTNLKIPQVDTIDRISAFASAHWSLSNSGFLVCQEIAPEFALGPKEAEILAGLVNEFHQRRDIPGREVTPRILQEFAQRTKGKSVQANIELLRANARLAGKIALAIPSKSPG